MTLVAFDYGEKKIGVAIGQRLTETANPLIVLKNNGEVFERIDRIILEWSPECVVLGMPVLADGCTHPLEKVIHRFKEKIELRYNLQVFVESETLTSVEAGKYRKGKRNRQEMDAHAAAIILESWMRSSR